MFKDWRKTGVSETQWQSYKLPKSIEALLHQMMQRHQLLYGAIDMIRTLLGEYVFLEVNPCGEWGMIEHELGEPIAAALSNTLIKRLS
ncbi:MAG: hypothetical protein R3E32_14875 [Chitinophagales bacterium]